MKQDEVDYKNAETFGVDMKMPAGSGLPDFFGMPEGSGLDMSNLNAGPGYNDLMADLRSQGLAADQASEDALNSETFGTINMEPFPDPHSLPDFFQEGGGNMDHILMGGLEEQSLQPRNTEESGWQEGLKQAQSLHNQFLQMHKTAGMGAPEGLNNFDEEQVSSFQFLNIDDETSIRQGAPGLPSSVPIVGLRDLEEISRQSQPIAARPQTVGGVKMLFVEEMEAHILAQAKQAQAEQNIGMSPLNQPEMMPPRGHPGMPPMPPMFLPGGQPSPSMMRPGYGLPPRPGPGWMLPRPLLPSQQPFNMPPRPPRQSGVDYTSPQLGPMSSPMQHPVLPPNSPGSPAFGPHSPFLRPGVPPRQIPSPLRAISPLQQLPDVPPRAPPPHGEKMFPQDLCYVYEQCIRGLETDDPYNDDYYCHQYLARREARAKRKLELEQARLANSGLRSEGGQGPASPDRISSPNHQIMLPIPVWHETKEMSRKMKEAYEKEQTERVRKWEKGNQVLGHFEKATFARPTKALALFINEEEKMDVKSKTGKQLFSTNLWEARASVEKANQCYLSIGEFRNLLEIQQLPPDKVNEIRFQIDRSVEGLESAYGLEEEDIDFSGLGGLLGLAKGRRALARSLVLLPPPSRWRLLPAILAATLQALPAPDKTDAAKSEERLMRTLLEMVEQSRMPPTLETLKMCLQTIIALHSGSLRKALSNIARAALMEAILKKGAVIAQSGSIEEQESWSSLSNTFLSLAAQDS